MANSIWAAIKENQDTQDSVVDFPTKTRFHIAVNVKNVKELESFYSKLFGREPHTSRDGYIKYDLDEPPLHLSLNEVPKNASGEGLYGIQAKLKADLDAIKHRLSELDYDALIGDVREGDSSLVAVDPEGNQWQIALLDMK